MQVLSGAEVNKVVFMCVRVSVFVSFIRTYACIGAGLLFCSTSSFYLLIQRLGVYEIRGLLIWRLIEF